MDYTFGETEQECLRQITQMRRTHGAGSDWAAILREAARFLVARPTAPPLSDLSDPATYLGFFGRSVDYAARPHKSKHYLALGSDICAKSDAWAWICEQITAGALHPEWIFRQLVDQRGVLFADSFRKIGDCLLPFCAGPTVATRLFSCRNAMTDLRIAKNGWTLASRDPFLKEYFEVAPRNVRRVRVRLTLERFRGHTGSETEPRDPKGNILNEPSGDELLPQASGESLLAQQSFPVLGPKWNTVPNPYTPERNDPDSSRTAPGPKAHRVDASSSSKRDLEFPNRHAMSPPASYLITVATEQLRLAGKEPTRGWPA